MSSTASPGGRARRIVIIGAVAAGTSVGTKAHRNDPEAEVVIYERDRDISYSGCGIPYFVGGEVDDAAVLHPRGPEWFAKRGVEVRTRHEVRAVEGRELRVVNLDTGEESTDHWDVLVLATGARAVVPPLPGIETDGVFTVRSIRDAEAIRGWLDGRAVGRAVIVGSGFIGLEMAEQLVGRGIAVTLVEKLPQVMPALDPDMATLVEEELRRHGVDVRLGAEVTAIEGGEAVTGVRLGDETVPADVVIVSVGVRPVVDLAEQLGVELGPTGAIAVDDAMRTSVPDVWAVGDVAENVSVITGAPLWRPLGSTANKTGRVAGDAITGGALRHRGVLGTGIVRVFDVAVGHTGLTEGEAERQGFDVVAIRTAAADRASYLGGRKLTVKAVADRATGRILGAQAVGPDGVDKRIDVLATAITFGATASDLFHLDLAYAPPFSTARDVVHYVGMALESALTGSGEE